MNEFMPKYIIIEKYITKKIKSGKYKVGMKIPSENDLAEKFNVSRVTANKAITELANQGIVDRIQGKGTFVSKLSVLNTELYHNTNKSIKISSEDAESRFHKTLGIEKIRGNDKLMKKFDIDKSEIVYKIKRLMLKNKSPMVIDYSYVPSKYLNENSDFKILDNAYLHEFLSIYNNVPVDSLHVQIDAKLPDDYEIEILKVNKNQPLVIWETSILNKNKKIIAFTTSIAHPKKYRAYIHFEL